MVISTLALPKLSQTFVVKIDACNSSVRVMLTQGKQNFPFLSKVLARLSWVCQLMKMNYGLLYLQ